jgi:ADP-ribose pyrophosphatase YjhB (NUDIX family)
MIADPNWPRVGCGAAIVKDGQLLLVRRRRAPEAGCWGLPGGKVDPFEPVADATAREIREELGIIITPTELLCLTDQIDRQQGYHWVAPVFLVRHYEGMPTIMEPEALSDWGWFEMDALPASLTQATRQAVASMNRSSV